MQSMFRFATVAVFLAAPLLAQSYELETEGNSIRLSINEGGKAMTEFVALANDITGHPFSFSKQEMANAEPVELIGELHIKKDAFLTFFKTMMHVKGFAVNSRGDGDAKIMEIVALKPAARQRPSDARYVPVEDLGKHKADTGMVLTSFKLQHVKTEAAKARLTTAFEAIGIKALAGQAGKSLLVQGTGREVYVAAEMVKLLDVPSKETFQVIALEHAKSKQMAKALKGLLAGKKGVVLVPHEKSNSLLVSGTPETVKQIVTLVEMLDRKTR